MSIRIGDNYFSQFQKYFLETGISVKHELESPGCYRISFGNFEGQSYMFSSSQPKDAISFLERIKDDVSSLYIEINGISYIKITIYTPLALTKLISYAKTLESPDILETLAIPKNYCVFPTFESVLRNIEKS